MFKDTLLAEIKRKKEKFQEAVSANGSSSGSSTKKFIKQGDLEKLEREEYHAKQAELDSVRAERQMKKEEEQRILQERKRKRVQEESNEEEDQIKISPEDLDKRLRALSHPIRLFGESDTARFKRLKHLEALQIIQPEGQRNEFMNSMNKMEEELLLEKELRKDSSSNNNNDNGNEGIMMGQDRSSSPFKKSEKQSVTPMLAQMTDLEPIELEMIDKNPAKLRFLLSLYFKRLLLEWKETLDARTDQDKRSRKGKIDSAVHEQTQEYIKPFFDRLKNDAMPADVFQKIVGIARFLQQREYVQANDLYLRLSIGNAPWPIGVTAVGIHERSARERIGSDQVAHVLNDEVQRKWIQSMKRLMTFCQRKYPPSDPSKAVG